MESEQARGGPSGREYRGALAHFPQARRRSHSASVATEASRDTSVGGLAPRCRLWRGHSVSKMCSSLSPLRLRSAPFVVGHRRQRGAPAPPTAGHAPRPSARRVTRPAWALRYAPVAGGSRLRLCLRCVAHNATRSGARARGARAATPLPGRARWFRVPAAARCARPVTALPLPRGGAWAARPPTRSTARASPFGGPAQKHPTPPQRKTAAMRYPLPHQPPPRVTHCRKEMGTASAEIEPSRERKNAGVHFLLDTSASTKL